MNMTGTEAISQGVYGFYLAERARQLAAELDALFPPGGTRVDDMAVAAWAGRAGVTLRLIAEEFAGPLPEPSRASCGHPANDDGECGCSYWPERAPNA